MQSILAPDTLLQSLFIGLPHGVPHPVHAKDNTVKQKGLLIFSSDSQQENEMFNYSCITVFTTFVTFFQPFVEKGALLKNVLLCCVFGCFLASTFDRAKNIVTTTHLRSDIIES